MPLVPPAHMLRSASAVHYTQEDAFEGVKVNVYQILGDISASFSHQQMDMLFSRFQAVKSRSVPDTLLLLELCRRLAFSDKQVSWMRYVCSDVTGASGRLPVSRHHIDLDATGYWSAGCVSSCLWPKWPE